MPHLVCIGAEAGGYNPATPSRYTPATAGPRVLFKRCGLRGDRTATAQVALPVGRNTRAPKSPLNRCLFFQCSNGAKKSCSSMFRLWIQKKHEKPFQASSRQRPKASNCFSPIATTPANGKCEANVKTACVCSSRYTIPHTKPLSCNAHRDPSIFQSGTTRPIARPDCIHATTQHHLTFRPPVTLNDNPPI